MSGGQLLFRWVSAPNTERSNQSASLEFRLVDGYEDRFVADEKYQDVCDHLAGDSRPDCPSTLAPNLLKETKARRLLVDRVFLAAILPVFKDPVLIPSVQVLDSTTKDAGVAGLTIQCYFIAIPGTLCRGGADACQLYSRVVNDGVLFVIPYI